MSTLSDSSVKQCAGGLAPSGQTTLALDATSIATIEAMTARVSETRALTSTLATGIVDTEE